MKLTRSPDDDSAYLLLDETAVVATRLSVADEDYPEAAGLRLDFDAAGRLVGVHVADAQRQLPSSLLTGEVGLAAHHDPQARAAYVYLATEPLARGSVADTLAFGDEETEPAWGVNLDFDSAGRLVGIELEADELAPPAVLADAVRIWLD